MSRWVKALDMLLDKLRVAGLDFTTVFVITHLIFSPLIFFLRMIVIIAAFDDIALAITIFV